MVSCVDQRMCLSDGRVAGEVRGRNSERLGARSVNDHVAHICLSLALTRCREGLQVKGGTISSVSTGYQCTAEELAWRREKSPWRRLDPPLRPKHRRAQLDSSTARLWNWWLHLDERYDKASLARSAYVRIEAECYHSICIRRRRVVSDNAGDSRRIGAASGRE